MTETDGLGSLSHLLWSSPEKVHDPCVTGRKENSPFPGDPGSTPSTAPWFHSCSSRPTSCPGACEQSKHSALSLLKHPSLQQASSHPFAGVRDAESPLSTRLCGGQLCGLRPECLHPVISKGTWLLVAPAYARCPVQVEHKRNAALGGFMKMKMRESAEDPAWRPCHDL